jgi:hypothetical protein
MLDEEHVDRDGEANSIGRLFLNIATGRFLRIELPQLTDYYFIINTGGLLVLEFS